MYPLINGNEYSWASVEIDFGGRSYFGISAFNWSEELTPEDVYGSDAVAISRTRGQYKASGDFEQTLSEYKSLIQRLGTPYGEKPFNIGIQYRETPGAGLTKVEIIAARIAKPGVSNSAGPGATKVKVELSIIEPIRIDGLTLVQRKVRGSAVSGGLTVA